MDHQWRPNPRAIQLQGNVCPTCLIPHFPFCPPPPPSSTFHPPPQPVNSPTRPYPYPSPNWPPHQHHPNTYDADNDRSSKRPRIDDDERRLKLIRDHGIALSNNPPQPQDLPHGYATPSPHHVHNAQFNTSPYPPQQLLGATNGLGYSHREMNAPYHEHIGVAHDFRPSSNATYAVNFPFSTQEGNHKLNGRVVHNPYPYPYPYPYPNEEASRFFRGQPPLPSSPPPPLPMDPPTNHLKTYFSPPKKPPSLFPVSMSSPSLAPSSYSQVPEAHPLPQPYFHNKPHLPEFSTGFPPEEHSKQYLGDGQSFSLNQFSAEKPKFVDASQLFRHPRRTSRPDHFVILLRGLPGSGKSYLAKMLRDLEVESGGNAPRIHSMDDYFMTEVEKAEDNDGSKSSSSGRNKKPVTKKVMEYCYEPEMEEAYRSSMLKAFKKTVEEGVFTFIIVDDRNLRVADFAQFWATAKRSGYEVYILEATYKDPAGCAARNVHGFT